MIPLDDLTHGSLLEVGATIRSNDVDQALEAARDVLLSSSSSAQKWILALRILNEPLRKAGFGLVISMR